MVDDCQSRVFEQGLFNMQFKASNVKESVWDRKKTSVKSSPCEFQCDFCQSTSL